MRRVMSSGARAGVRLAFFVGAVGCGDARALPDPDPDDEWSRRVAAALAARTASRIPPTAEGPSFVVDPTWPKPLPNYWQVGNIGGLYVDRDDNVWVYHRPRELQTTEAGGLGTAGTDPSGAPVNGLGHPTPWGRQSEGSIPAPSVLKLDRDGNVLAAWGGPSDPGFLEQRCVEAEGCFWPAREHGIFVDQDGFVYLSGNGELRRGTSAGEYPWAADFGGDDSHVLEFTADGTFVRQIGRAGVSAPNSNAVDGGPDGTPQPYLAADMVVDPGTNRMFVADGYGNRRVLVVDAETGSYLGHFGAYGQHPVDDEAALDESSAWPDDHRSGAVPSFFRGPVHCVVLTRGGELHVCDRGNNRLQVFDAAAVGRPCENPDGVPGRCGFLREVFVAPQTPSGTVGSVALSSDPGETCLYMADLANNTVYVVNRENGHELDRIGRTGRQVGEFVMLHAVSVDSDGNLYTGEVGGANRVQRFLRYGAEGCSGTHREAIGEWDVYPFHR